MTVPQIYGHPGIFVSESLNGPTPSPLTTSPSVGGFIGQHYRGPTQAVLCNGWNDFVRYFGGFNPNLTPVLANPYLPYSVYMFFANGGQSAWILRTPTTAVAGASASTVLHDSSATPQGTLSLTAGLQGVAGNVGTWGNQLYVDVVLAGSGAGRFNLNIYSGGYGAQFRVEQWIDMSMIPTDDRYAPALLNSPSQGSLFVVATDLGDVAAAPNNAPAVVSGQQFSGGTDPGNPATSDRIATVTQGSPTALFDTVNGMLNFNLPGEVTPSVASAAIAYAGARPASFAVLDTPSGLTPAGAVSYAASLSPISQYAAVYYPWQNASNPSSSNLGSTILLPPGGFVLGQIAKSDASSGTWRAPAGISTALSGVAAAERKFAPADLDTLTENNINAIDTLANGAIVIWGTRTMQSGYATLYIPIRRTLNYIESALTTLLQFAIFEPNDQLLWTNITAACNSFLDGLFAAGAFPGSTSQASYYVTCNDTNNTQSTIAQGIVNTQVGVALLYPAEFIALNIAQFQNGGATTVTTTS